MTWGSRYETIAEIGTGGMASVWVGRVTGGSDRLVALKRAHAFLRSDRKATEAMVREANLAALVRHPNVVGVHAVDHVDGDLVIVLDYVEGCTLRLLATRLEDARVLRPREMVRILLDVAAGLHAAHQTGLVHRDVSPSNILVGSDGVAKLADFGIAKAQFESDGERTATGILKGKLAYMAPEYIASQQADRWSDLFSFAVVAWESLTGVRLFKGDSDLETLARIADADVHPISSVRPELAAFDRVLLRALSKRREDRQASIEELADELLEVARAYDLVASHAEVAALVEHIAEPELADRRRLLRRSVANSFDDMPTSLRILPEHVPEAEPSGDLPTQVHTSRPSFGPPPPSASAPPVAAPTARRVPTVVVATTRVRRNTRSSEVEARREKLALVGALMLLALALGWMFTQLQTKDPPPRIPAPIANDVVNDAGASPSMDAGAAPVPNGSSQRGKRPRR